MFAHRDDSNERPSIEIQERLHLWEISDAWGCWMTLLNECWAMPHIWQNRCQKKHYHRCVLLTPSRRDYSDLEFCRWPSVGLWLRRKRLKGRDFKEAEGNICEGCWIRKEATIVLLQSQLIESLAVICHIHVSVNASFCNRSWKLGGATVSLQGLKAKKIALQFLVSHQKDSQSATCNTPLVVSCEHISNYRSFGFNLVG